MYKLIVIISILTTSILITSINGFLFSRKEKCQISEYKGGKDFSGEKIMANKSFIPYLKSVGAVAKGCKVRVHVTDSYKQLKTPTEYVLASQMPLALGRGIHFDLQSPKGSTVCNKLCMTTGSWKTFPEAACFIDNVQKKGVRFTEPNLLHDGYASTLTTSDLEALKVAAQKLCAPKTKNTKC
ncbi:unnamed protein product [Rotaria socialis]|uniref:Uncharacterized protein n=1 Tax=Rotaria socialis TaxID=392032 RepID=A0A817SLD5_9BILA|nr:unnamed protein product [Rotaria socialis]CAF3301483.1 unnamed protein product [Rotaria socialis]CAF3383319.1 unnamed protein product [Rotaria socialis]CAF3433836.1 unnamed protein product [Rotaria socialis]CAF4465558.1 unnamed protein product [Rotaria socialis]